MLKHVTPEEAQWMVEEAQAGDVSQQLTLAKIFLEEPRSEMQVNQVVLWLQPAIAKGNIEALGLAGAEAYEYKEFKDAFEWFRKAGAQGGAYGQFMVATMYTRGEGVPQNYELATDWAIQSAEQGFAPAQALMGLCFSNGWGVPQDKSTAYLWLALASANEPSFIDWRDEVAEVLTKEQIDFAQKKALDWEHNRTQSQITLEGTQQ
ncbi:MAG: sel1 repeat family protein [Candidatus Hydrogenedentes bacterium]|nr:sel1 repeat family protein [Candidatus Hydrogenedentota bacterium]